MLRRAIGAQQPVVDRQRIGEIKIVGEHGI